MLVVATQWLKITMSDQAQLRIRSKSCVAMSLITLLLLTSFVRPFFSSQSSISYTRFLKYILYVTTILLGGMYVWRRLVLDIEGSFNYDIKPELPFSKNDVNHHHDEVVIERTTMIRPRALFKSWKILVLSFLCLVVVGYVRMHSRVKNTFIGWFDTFCFTVIGFGAFLVFTLLVMDFVLIVFFCWKVVLSSLFCSCQVKETEYSLHLNTFLDDVVNNIGTPQKLFCLLKKNSDDLIKPVWKAAAVVATTIMVILYSLNCAHNVLKVTHYQIPVKTLPPALENFKIVQVCDFHIGPWLWREHVEKVVSKVNELQPDIIVIVGDLVDLTMDKVAEAIDPLKKIRANKGVFFVGGNHDYYLNDVDRLYSTLEGMGIKVLKNQNVKICQDNRVDNSCLILAGTEDISQGKSSRHSFSLSQTMKGVDTSKPVILLTHQPLAAHKTALSEFKVDLILSGHTHGGQFFPVSLIVYICVPYFQGLYHLKEGTYLYVSNGVGFWGIPMRLMAPPEVAVLSLVPHTLS